MGEVLTSSAPTVRDSTYGIGFSLHKDTVEG